MIDFKTWDKWVEDFDTYRGKRKVRITTTSDKAYNGKIFEGTCCGYVEDEDSNENACWAIEIEGWKFLQEDVEKIEFID